MGKIKLPYLLSIIALLPEITSAAHCNAALDCIGTNHCSLMSHHWICQSNRCSCERGSKPITSSDSKYTVGVAEVTYNEAVSACRKQGKRLLHIDNYAKYQEVMQFSQPIIKAIYPHESILGAGTWIGLHHKSTNPTDVTYTHPDGTAASFFMWEHNEPNQLGSDHCVRLDANFLMRTTDCTHDNIFICETIPTSSLTTVQPGTKAVLICFVDCVLTFTGVMVFAFRWQCFFTFILKPSIEK